MSEGQPPFVPEGERGKQTPETPSSKTPTEAAQAWLTKTAEDAQRVGGNFTTGTVFAGLPPPFGVLGVAFEVVSLVRAAVAARRAIKNKPRG